MRVKIEPQLLIRSPEGSADLPLSLEPKGVLLGPVLPMTISVPFVNPQPPLLRHCIQKSSLTPPPTTYTHGFP